MKILFTIPTEDGVRERFQGIAPHAEFVFADSAELSESDIESADILIGNVPPTMLHAPAGLRFFQTYTAGANAYTVPGVLAPETVLCNASGAYGVALAEHMLAQLLMVIKKLDIYLDAQKEHSWIDAGPSAVIRRKHRSGCRSPERWKTSGSGSVRRIILPVRCRRRRRQIA